MTVMTVIFDRSAFHGDNFSKLVDSTLAELVKRNVIRVHHTQIFLEETLGMFEKEKNRGILKLQTPYIFKICNGKWLQDREKIWDRELVCGSGKNANVWVPAHERTEKEILWKKYISNETGFQELLDGFEEKNLQRKKQAKQFELSSLMRDEISNASIKRMHFPPTDFIKREAPKMGFELIRSHEKVTDPHAIYKKWRMNKKCYPFFTGFVEGFLYSQYYAMVEAGNGNGKRIDRNAQADIEQLTYLAKADLLVSCDQRFMLDAFKALWETKGKKIMTTDEFICYLATIN